MLSSDAESFLRSLLQTPGPSGFEARVARVWRERAASYGGLVSADVTGNSFAVFNPQGSPTVLLVGHLDEIGVIVQHIDDDGFISLAPIGGWDPQVLVGQRIRILGRDGDTVAIVGRKPIHLIKREDRDKAASLTDLWVDLGASSRADAEQLVSVGDAGVVDAQVVDLANRRLASRSLDNRAGAFVVLEAARQYGAAPGMARVVALAATQEEIGYRGGGALVGAARFAPAMALVVDMTFATDDPGGEKKELGLHKIGGGPVISRGGVLSPVVFGMLVAAARAHGIPHTIQANAGVTGTDADAIIRAGHGVAVGLVSIPNRYMHSPNEMVSLDDLDHAITLLTEATRSVSHTTNFAPG